MKQPAVFLDRDGVINDDCGYASKVSDARLLPGVAAAIRDLNERSIPVIVISNQSGIARGYHTEDDTNAFNAALAKLLKAGGARVDAWYFCPHLPDGSVEKYKKDCDCRKPKPGMLVRAAEEHDIDLAKSFLVGDKESDIEAGRAAGVTTIFVGNQDVQTAAHHRARDLQDARGFLEV